MSKPRGGHVVPDIQPAKALPSDPAGEPIPHRLSLAQVLPTTTFPTIGCILHSEGMPLAATFELLLGCGAIGVLVTLGVTGGRRLLVALAHGVLALANNR
ncbi:hypothetical protein [Streptomyces sp. NPDC007905]|uniref:hypothetical protein n=1 Tax=Streptomyces sp. NPDC007905 TaxID=3364788 RepID=UPI0036DFB9A8